MEGKLEIMINRDIREYKTKFFGPFTMKQSICFIFILFIMLITYMFQTELLKMETATYIPGIILSIIPILVGWGDSLFGMPFEDYIQTVFISRYKKPKHRPLKLHNYHLIAIEKIKEEEALNEDKKETKKSKNTVSLRHIPPELRAYE